MSVNINGSTGVSLVQDGVIVTADMASSVPLGTKNLIINGNMQIAQRGTSATGITGDGLNTVDRFTRELNTAGTWTMTQDTDVPTGEGFASSMKYSCTTANASLGSGAYFAIESRNEGQNFQQLKYGSANAESVTLSFWVKSNKTGTYTLEFYRVDSNRDMSNTYTIDSADTWEKKTITIDGDTTGVIDNDNGDGYRLLWWMGAGTAFTSGTLATSWATISNPNRVSSSNVNLADSTDNYINITGVQLELGSTATAFEYRMYGQELALCQRYYQTSYPSGVAADGVTTITDGVTWVAINTADTSNGGSYPTPMRATPTFTIYYPGGGSGVNSARDNDAGVAITTIGYTGGTATTLPRLTKGSGFTTRANTIAAQYTATSEL